VRLVGPNGEQVGIVRVEDALRLAAEADLDLVEVAPMARPPVAKLMDFGKYKYEAAMKAREARKNQVNTVIKEIKLRPKIDPHDYGTKKGHVERFLKGGDKVKVTIMFRGREQSRPELGFRLLQRLAEDIQEFGFVESAPKQDGRNMIMVIGPTKKKSEAKAEARRARETAAGTQGPIRAERSHSAPPASGDHDDLVESLEADLAEVTGPADEALDAPVAGDALDGTVASAPAAPEADLPVVDVPVVDVPVVDVPVVDGPAVQTADAANAAETEPTAAVPEPMPEPTPEPVTPAREPAPAAAAPKPAPRGAASPKPVAPARKAAVPGPSTTGAPAAHPTPRPAAPARGAAPKPTAPKPGPRAPQA
jgi:translation initiation factor IF-3